MSGRRPLVIGLTGSIGMGKTTTAKMFASLGIPVFDADAAVHRLYEPGGGAVGAVADAFPGTTSKAGRVDRAALAKRLAAEPEGLLRLEQIVHPLVVQEQERFVEHAGREGADLVVLDIPLLFETGRPDGVDALVVVSAPDHVQRSRVLSRPEMTEAKLRQLLARQMPDAEKRAQAHFVVETDRGLDHAMAQVQRIVAALRARHQGQHRA